MTPEIKDIFVDGHKWPSPAVEGISIKESKVWSKNTGRLESTAAMAGTIVAVKRSIPIKFNAVTPQQAEIVRADVSSLTPFHTLRLAYVDGSAKTITGYFDDFDAGIYSYADGLMWITDMSVTLVEQ